MTIKDFFSKQPPPSTTLTDALVHYKSLTEEKIRSYIPSMGEKTVLREACEYSLLNGGKRFRPALVHMVAKALGNAADVSYAALAIEFFHTASLVADDMPCMDNEEYRRNKPTVHKVYGESTALLVTYALISSAYECLAKCGQVLAKSKLPIAENSDQVTLCALANATRNTGLNGATGGQFIDLNPPNMSIGTLKDVMDKKTVSLFDIAFTFGWLFGGGDIKKLDQVKKAAAHFGMAFQIADDIGDMAQDTENECKVNFATALGLEKAVQIFHEEIEAFEKSLKELKIDSPDLMELSTYLNKQVHATL